MSGVSGIKGGAAVLRQPTVGIAHWALLGLVCSWALPAVAQDSAGAGPKREWVISPRVVLTATATDNARLGGGGKQADQIFEAAPGIRVVSGGARLKGSLDFSVRELMSAQQSSRNAHQFSLNTTSTLEAIENWLFVDTTGVISQQSISAFGAQSADANTVNANQTETSTYRISPYLRGVLWGKASYELRYSAATTRSKAAQVADTDMADWSAVISSPRATVGLGWRLEAGSQQSTFGNGRTNESDRIRGALTFQVNPQFSLSASLGQETNNFLGAGSQRTSNHGFGAEWRPTERTRLNIERDKRFFGNGHRMAFEHRSPRTVWRFSSTRDVSVAPGLTGQPGPGTMFDLFFTQFASIEPDPVLRAILVNNFLQANGISPTQVLNNGFVNSGVSLQRRHEASVALIGARNTLTFLASQSESSRAGAAGPVADDFTVSSVIRQRGFNVSLAHKISALSSLNLLAAEQRTQGDLSAQETTLRTLNVTLSHRLGRYTNASLTARHSTFDSTATPYTENALSGTVSVQF